jgi:pyruvate/2-oxoglutarate dehydrogenase complex dihydrolipoamide acyltransferase (E2) component
MAHEVILPKQGQSVETCLILGWKKKVGEIVQEGEALVEVETDKASFEIPAPVSGTLLAVFHEQGEDVPVLAPLALIGQPGEVPQPSSSAPAPVAQAAPSAPAAPAAQATPPRCRKEGAAAPEAGFWSAICGRPCRAAVRRSPARPHLPYRRLRPCQPRRLPHPPSPSPPAISPVPSPKSR